MQGAAHWGKASPSQGPQTPAMHIPARGRQPTPARNAASPAAAPGAGQQRSPSVLERAAGRVAWPSPRWQVGDEGIPGDEGILAREGNLSRCRPLPAEVPGPTAGSKHPCTPFRGTENLPGDGWGLGGGFCSVSDVPGQPSSGRGDLGTAWGSQDRNPAQPQLSPASACRRVQ